MPTRWQENRLRGLCGRCGKNPPAPGKARCQDCLALAAEDRASRTEAADQVGLCVACKQRPQSGQNRLCSECNRYQRSRPGRKEQAREYRRKLRDEVFYHYGGYVCNCCGEDEPLFLSIDHVESDAHWSLNDGPKFYLWLRKQGFPAGFQVLCLNCNIGKMRNGGFDCPHKWQ